MELAVSSETHFILNFKARGILARFLGTVFIRQNKDDFTSLPINLCSHEIFQNEQNSQSFLGRRILNWVRIQKPDMSGLFNGPNLGGLDFGSYSETSHMPSF